MDNLDDLLAPSRYRDDICHTAQALEQVDDPEKRAKIAAAARHPKVPVEKVREAFLALTGATPKPQTLRRHRKGECACG